MKRFKLVIVLVALAAFLSQAVYAAGTATTLLAMRDKIFEEAKELKALLATTKNVVLVNNMWDTCMITMTQLEAYFFMIGVLSAVKGENVNQEAIDYLIMWLNEVKKTNALNIKGLAAIAMPMEPETKAHVDKLKNYFSELNDKLDAELTQISRLRAAVPRKRR